MKRAKREHERSEKGENPKNKEILSVKRDTCPGG
jgi:hypothetical protein